MPVDRSIHVYSNSTTPLPSDTIPSTTPRSRHAALVLPPLVLLVLVTCTSNAMVVFCCRRHPKLRSVTWFYISSLAIVDFSVGLFAMVGMTLFTLHGYWPLSPALCTIWVTFDASYCSVSMFHLCLIAWDRYQALVHPTLYRLHQKCIKRALFLTIGAWILGIAVWVPVVLWVRLRATQREVRRTHCLFLPTSTFTCIQTLVVFALPICLLLYLYITCLVVLRRRSLSMLSVNRTRCTAQGITETNLLHQDQLGPALPYAAVNIKRCNTESNIASKFCFDNGDGGNPATNANGIHLELQRSSSDGGTEVAAPIQSVENTNCLLKTRGKETYCGGLERLKSRSLADLIKIKVQVHTTNSQNLAPIYSSSSLHINIESSYQYQQTVRSIRTLGLLVVAFLFCWLPFCTMWPIQAMCSSCVPLELYEYSYWIAYVNSLLNPFLYVLSNKDFRDAAKCQKILHSWAQRCQMTESSSFLSSPLPNIRKFCIPETWYNLYS